MRCDSCERRVRPNQHGIRLSDLLTGQLVGQFHARPGCRDGVTRHFDQPGAALRVSVVHPSRCGDDFEKCDGGLLEEIAPT
jgi:hypothetical protein